MELIPKDSTLRKIPTSVDRRTILFLDGVRYSIQAFELASSRLALTLDRLSNGKEITDDLGEIISEATTDAWSIIDSIHRLRELLEQMPGLKKNVPELQLFLRRTAPVEDLRHFFQHFRTEIESFVERGMPLWGTISWAYANPATGLPETHTIVPGTFFDGAWVATCTFDTQEGKFVERVLLHAGPRKIDLADLADHVKEFARWYTNWFDTTFTDQSRHGADVHMQFYIKPVTEAQPKQ
jgi:hypothetical protein